ncbi:MAG: VapC toxin family PIN domain ribonuclease [Flexibacter sp. CG_4_10_14_3_um_filter_32_15]|nr:MAG: VapC toxin family PIN domain ribonuclease [Flexibacter sp. CG_4_10_14_3_um_filter_32_15]PJB18747.1 MAG: VapC toxin family PIN domain ribonuclease [Flavobacteriaceae bacterium CG_4_9_14_3_um_filter_33_16]
MNGKFLLDTNILIALFKHEKAIIEKLSEQDNICYTSFITIGELYYGAFNSFKIEENLLQLSKLRQVIPILKSSDTTSMLYGKIKTGLKQKGKPIPENDIWIAALAKEHDLILVTRDKHFEEIEDLKVEKW